MFRERRSSERWSGERFKNPRKGAGWLLKRLGTGYGVGFQKISDSNFEFDFQRPQAFVHPTFNPAEYPYHLLSFLPNLAYNHSVLNFSGHRGFPRSLWGRRPREPPSSRTGPLPMNSTTLFIDCIHHKCSNSELRDFFKAAGKVVDSFISFKKRATRNGLLVLFAFRLERRQKMPFTLWMVQYSEA
ncbi:unnamed protein product [Amaranthus hypochondriacus]